VRVYVSNRLPEATSVHWHGIRLPAGMDGISGLNQKEIAPGETFRYEFIFPHEGTFMYHPHFDEMTQMAMGLMGMIVVHPRRPKGPRADRDFSMMLSEWFIKPGTRRPDPNAMEGFNILTINSRAFPGTAPLVVKRGDRVRMRFGNLSAMDHHPVHLHGHRFFVTETDGGQIPEAGQWPETTVLVQVGSTRAVEFVADNPGDWGLHCHMTHHIMNQMGHGLPNLLGINADGLDEKIRRLVPGYMTMGQTGMGGMGNMGMAIPSNSIPMLGKEGPFGYIDMGGMFTILKVREDIANYDDPGWFQYPTGSVARPATPEELKQDAIVPPVGKDIPAPPAPAMPQHE
ncbi:MAG: multicopper oxidase domain-containing protein, partial [Planctomycetota bacterium]